MLFCVFFFFCQLICVCMHMFVHESAFVWGPEVTLAYCSFKELFVFVFLLTCSSLIRLVWLSQSILSQHQITNRHHQLFSVCPGEQTQVLMFAQQALYGLSCLFWFFFFFELSIIFENIWLCHCRAKEK